MRLKEMKIGIKARIVKLSSDRKGYRHRLISMGLIPGTELIISQIAPLGDPIKVQVRGFILSLRKDEAHILELEEVAV